MMLSDAIDVIRAYYLDGQVLEWNDNGKWKSWYGKHGELFDWLKDGRIFRVKREPRTLWAEQDGQRLTGVCWTHETDARLSIGPDSTLVEFREVL